MRKLRKKGQSLVEFALVLTLLFFMLAGLIDFGLAFFAYQGISGAAQEGASYAAINPQGELGYPEVRKRVVSEAGLNTALAHRARFVNLFDLNSDKAIDNEGVWSTYIVISIVASDLIDYNTRPADWQEQTDRCNEVVQAQRCAMQVQVKYDYKAFFPAAKLFFGTDMVQLSATRRMTISR